MVYNLSIVFRSYLKDKLYSLILVAGLTIGMTAFLFIQLYIDYEKSFDQFHLHKDRIYRVQQDRYNQGELRLQTVAVNAAAGPSMVKNFPEVERYVQFFKLPGIIQYNNTSFKEERLAFASKDFFKVFSFRLLNGVDSLVLKEPYSIVLSKSAAKRYFKDEDPIGKVVIYRGKYDLEVTGIYEDMPENSHFKFDVLLSFETYYKFTSRVVKLLQEEPWRWDGYYSYILLRGDANVQELEDKIPALIEAETGQWLKETNQDLKLSLQPLSGIHLYSAFNGEIEPNGDIQNIKYLQVVAIFLICIAWINYISLTTAKSVERGKEVGIRKVLGSNKNQLIRQFISEAFVLNLVATCFSLSLLFILVPYFNEMIERKLNIFDIWNNKLWLFIAVILAGGTFASGFYPAWVLSSFKPALILKGKFQASAGGKTLRKIAVILPFSISITLVSCLFIIYSQISFLRNQTLGFSLKQKLVIRDSEIYDSLYHTRLASFKAELVRLPGIEKTTYVSIVPGDPLTTYANGVKRLSASETQVNQYKYLSVDENFTGVFDLKILAGRNFTHSSIRNKDVLINELAAKQLGFKDYENAVNEKIIFRDDTVQILGVVNNLYHESPKTPFQPVVYVFNPDAGLFFIVPLETVHAATTVEKVNHLFSTIFPSQPFVYFFLDDKYNNQYKTDIQFGKIMMLFSLLLLFTAGLGLFGLSTYSASVRSKEIGIRKVLGATEATVVLLFLKEYVLLIAIACCIAIPVSWYIMQLWLENFSNRIQITISQFLLPCLFIAIFTLLMIGFQTVKAALTNPAQTLRQE